jgi:hypothetical protein
MYTDHLYNKPLAASPDLSLTTQGRMLNTSVGWFLGLRGNLRFRFQKNYEAGSGSFFI